MTYAPGTPVRITDGTTRPPARFNKKLDAWKGNNYLAIARGPGEYGPGRTKIRMISRAESTGYIIYIGESRNERTQPFPGALLPMVDEGFDGMMPEPQAFRAWCAEFYAVSEALEMAPLADVAVAA